MNILWVEDEFSEQKQIEWFNQRNVSLKTNFLAAKEAINNSLEQFDVAVLDINLENTEHSAEIKRLAEHFKITEQAFLEESGMNLFLILLEKGFPKEQIIFLTASADTNISLVGELRKVFVQKNREEFERIFSKIQDGLSEEQIEKCQYLINNNIMELFEYLENYYESLIDKNDAKSIYNRFCEAYTRCRIDPPEAINIKLIDEGKSSFKAWLEKHEKNDYLMLRRGIIECCNFLKNHIKDDNNIQLRSFVKGSKINNPAIEILMPDIENYLDTVAQFLPARPPEAINDEYRLFLRTLVHEWEQNIDPQELPREKYGSDIHTFAWLSKQTRNWVSHAKLLEPLNSEIIAFLFLVNMRAMFKLPVEIQSYEQILLKCISKNPANFIDNDELEERINDSKINVDSILESIPLIEKIDKCGKLVNREKTYFKKRYFSEKINDIYLHNTGKTKNHDYQAFLFQLFWANQQNYLADLTANSDDFLPTLARHIYNRKNAEE